MLPNPKRIRTQHLARCVSCVVPNAADPLSRVKTIVQPIRVALHAWAVRRRGAPRLADIAADLNATKTELAGLISDLRARPYTARPDIFATVDDRGREQIGFRKIEPPKRAGYLGFEDIFRGSEELVRERQAGYVELVRDRKPVLDIGCGRGEFLDLLSEAGIAGLGVDLTEEMVDLCREKGHDVELADGIQYLASRAEQSLGAIFSAQVIEHLPYAQLDQLFRLAATRLATNGVLILETVNPHSVRAMQGFWVDPTHIRPIPPDAVVALCWLHGFAEATVVFPLGTGELRRDLYETGEYAVVARTAGARQG
jgi:SAM-dependent methyltransferase